MDAFDSMTDQQLIAYARETATAEGPEEAARIEAFAARFGESALALYPLVWDLVAGAHADCLKPEGIEGDENGRCWAVESRALTRVEQAMGMQGE